VTTRRQASPPDMLVRSTGGVGLRGVTVMDATGLQPPIQADDRARTSGGLEIVSVDA
jgi:hypothetical protein